MLLQLFFQASMDVIATILASALMIVLLARYAYRLRLMTNSQLVVAVMAVVLYEVLYGNALWTL